MKIDHEPTISVGLLENLDSVIIHLLGDFIDEMGNTFSAGDYCVEVVGERMQVRGKGVDLGQRLRLQPVCSPGKDDQSSPKFSLQTTIGVQFHWQQKEVQTFGGSLVVLLEADAGIYVINEIALEKYLQSVICSEMNANSPTQAVLAHTVISRSWLLAQIEATESIACAQEDANEIVRYTDRQKHSLFDVCADDHCQRYQGIGRILPERTLALVQQTRGQVLCFDQQVCDARFSKCCGGVTEDFRIAWSDQPVAYLVPVFDGEGELPDPPLTQEASLRQFIHSPPDCFCHCADQNLLKKLLVSYDQKTQDFFRWKVSLSGEQVGQLVKQKLGLDLGKVQSIQPVQRGLSGRLVKMRLVGDKSHLVLGKELEIRRCLSESHLYSSAFVVEEHGTQASREFVLWGSGWGHGVGLCQIGAGVMAAKGYSFKQILAHYYPGAQLSTLYA